MHLGHKHFWYTTITNNYPVMVCDFFYKMRAKEDTSLIKVAYGNNVHTISIEVTVAAIGIQPGYTTDKNPNGSQALGDWVEEIVHGGHM